MSTTPQYIHLTYEDYKHLEDQLKAFKETTHTTTGGFYHKSIRLRITEHLIMEFHGPNVGGYGHHEDAAKVPQAKLQKQLDDQKAQDAVKQGPPTFALGADYQYTD